MLLLFTFLESFISKIAISEISIFKLVSVAEETGLSLVLLETCRLEAHVSISMRKHFSIKVLYFENITVSIRYMRRATTRGWDPN